MLRNLMSRKAGNEDLAKWLKAHYRRLNWPKAERLLGTRATLGAKQEEYAKLGGVLVSRLQDLMRPPKAINFGILNVSRPNAWAIYAARFYGILVTKGLIENIQRVCGQAGAMMRGADVLEDQGNFLRNLWLGFQVRKEDYENFGGLLAHIAFAFIIHHELAHAGLGHEGVASNPKSASDGASSDSEIDTQYVDEALNSIAHDSAGVSWSSQALEVDADINGLGYTVDWIQSQANSLKALNVDPAKRMDAVWHHFLTDADRRWFVMLTGVSIGLYCLVNDLDLVPLGDMTQATHPPLPARVLAMLHAGSMLHKIETECAFNAQSDVLLVVTGLIGMLQVTQGDSRSLDDWFSALAVDEGVARYDDIGAHYRRLANEMAEIHQQRLLYMRFPDGLCWKWFLKNSEQT
jgi:hypothetical protein